MNASANVISNACPAREPASVPINAKFADDVGSEALKYIHTRLQIDEEWTDRRERGFTWWAHRLAQHIDAGKPLADSGVVLTRISSRIPVLRGVKSDTATVEAVLASWNYISDSYSYVYDPLKRTIDSVQIGIVHEQTLGWRPELLAAGFIVQLCHAEEDAPALRRALGGRMATCRHPTQGRRTEPDDMLNVVWTVFKPRGTGRTSFADKFEFDTICEQTCRINAASFGASTTGVVFEVPFGNSTALVALDAKQEHPRIGAGLGVFLQLPTFSSFEECATLAAWLNRQEAGGAFLSPCWGSWSVKRNGGSCTVAHCGFIPNAMHRQGLAMDAAAGAIMKLKQVNRLMNPGVPEPDAWKVVADRLGIATPVEAEA